MLTFVHAHVDTDAVIGALSEVADVKAAFVLGCCQPGKQFSSRYPITHEGEDEGVLSPDRHFQVIEPQQELGE